MAGLEERPLSFRTANLQGLRMMQYIRPALLFLTLLLSSCQSSSPATAPLAGSVEHVVLMWMKNPDDAAARRQIVDVTNSFKQIPGVLAIAYGPAIPSTRPVVDSSFHVGIIITFRDRQSASAYETHPIHQKAVREVLQPLVGKLQVYDILAQ